MVKKVLVSGATSFVGSNVIKGFLDQGYEIAALVRQSSDFSRLLKLIDKEKIYTIDKTYESFDLALSDFKPDAVLHLASWFIVGYEPKQIDEIISSNITFGTHLLEAMSQNGCEYMINTGTYWQHDDSSEYHPRTLYSATREAFSDVLDYYCLNKNVKAISLKLYDVYGANDPRKKIFWALENAGKTGEPMQMTPGEQQICPVYIDDVVEAYLTSVKEIQKQKAPHEDYFIGEDVISLKDMVETYIKISGADIKIEWGALPYRESQIMKPYVGKQLPNWNQKVSLEEGLAKILR